MTHRRLFAQPVSSACNCIRSFAFSTSCKVVGCGGFVRLAAFDSAEFRVIALSPSELHVCFLLRATLLTGGTSTGRGDQAARTRTKRHPQELICTALAASVAATRVVGRAACVGRI